MAIIISMFQDGILMVGTVKSAELRHCAKFCRNSNHCRDITFFIFQDDGRRNLGCKNFKFLTVIHAEKVELLHCAKFRLNLSNRDRHHLRF